ncbi:MAG: LEPR-XLL domain-containing protein, partial [Methylophilaceae bacterium]
MRKSAQKNDRPDRRRHFSISPLMSAMMQVFSANRKPAKSSSTAPESIKKEPHHLNSSIRFEAIEPRVLLSADVNPTALTIAGTISAQGEQDHYEFAVQDTHRVILDSLTNRSDLNWQLEGPTGVVANRGFSSTDNNGASPIYELIAGQYKLTVDGVQDALGDYSLRIIDVNGAASLTPNVPVNDTLDVGNKTAVYKFTATAGDNFFFSANALSASANWHLIDPFGRQEGAYYGLGSDRDTFSVARTGEYLLVVEGDINNTVPLSYQFNLRTVNHSTQTIALNSTAIANIDHAGKTAKFTFDITQNTPVIFDKLTSEDFYWALTGPMGEQVSNRYAYDNDPYGHQGFERLLLTPGSYTLTLDLSGASTGVLPFRLLSETSAQSTALGAIVTDTLDLSRGSKLYKVTLQKGDQVSIDGRTVTNGSVGWRLIDAYGVRLASGDDLTAFIAPFAAKVSGEYWLVLDGSDNNVETALLIRSDLSVIHAAYFTRASWKNFFTRSGDLSNTCMCSAVAAF